MPISNAGSMPRWPTLAEMPAQSLTPSQGLVRINRHRLRQRPKLTAVALVDGSDFGSRLDRAITASRAPLVIDHRPSEVVEHDASELER